MAIVAFALLGLGVRAVPALGDEDWLSVLSAPGPPSPAAPSSRVGPMQLTGPPANAPDAKRIDRKPRSTVVIAVPATGPGTYETARQQVEPASTRGRLIRYDVRVEDNLEIDPDEAAQFIAAVLNDERSWRGTDQWRFALVPAGEPADLHAYLVTPGTTNALCAPLLTRGEVSCQNGNRVVLNGKRWALGADAYGSDLKNYRRYLVNHEVGHYLGYRHVQCPGEGRAAPVMMQQTKGLAGCRKNPWPQASGD